MINLLLLILAIALSIVLFPIGFIFALITFKFRLSDYYIAIAYSIDQLGNVIMAQMFNIILIQRDSIFKFGNPDWTISAVLGGNLKTNKLKKIGRALVNILDKIEDNHCVNAFNNETNGREIKE